VARVVIEVPEEVAVLMEKEPLLKLAIAEAVIREVTEYLLAVMTLDKLAEDSKLGEEDVMRISGLVKRAVRERWDAESSGRY